MMWTTDFFSSQESRCGRFLLLGVQQIKAYVEQLSSTYDCRKVEGETKIDQLCNRLKVYEYALDRTARIE